MISDCRQYQGRQWTGQVYISQDIKFKRETFIQCIETSLYLYHTTHFKKQLKFPFFFGGVGGTWGVARACIYSDFVTWIINGIQVNTEWIVLFQDINNKKNIILKLSSSAGC